MGERAYNRNSAPDAHHRMDIHERECALRYKALFDAIAEGNRQREANESKQSLRWASLHRWQMGLAAGVIAILVALIGYLLSVKPMVWSGHLPGIT